MAVTSLERSGKRLWPVRAEGNSLFCAALPKGSYDPQVLAIQRLQAIRYRLPFGQSAATSEGALSRRQSKLEEACDTQKHHRRALPPQEAQSPEEAPDQVAPEVPTNHTSTFTEATQHSKDADEEAINATNPGDTVAAQEGEHVQEASADKTPTAAEPHAHKEDVDEVPSFSIAQPAILAAANEMTTTPIAQPAVPAPVTHSVGGLDPEIARRIAENRAKALARKAALAATKASPATEADSLKRLRSPSAERHANGSSLQDVPSAVRLRSC